MTGVNGPRITLFSIDSSVIEVSDRSTLQLKNSLSKEVVKVFGGWFTFQWLQNSGFPNGSIEPVFQSISGTQGSGYG